MKKSVKFLLLAVLFCISVIAFIACTDDKKDTGEDPENKKEIILSQTELDLTVGEEYALSATYDFEGEESWKSSAPDVASVTDNGLVTALKKGNAEITLTVGDVSAKCVVSVSDPVMSLHFYEEPLNAKVSENYTVTLTCINGEGKAVEWSVSDPAMIEIVEEENTVTKQECDVTVKILKSGSGKIIAEVDGVQAELEVQSTDKYDLVFNGISESPSHLISGTTYALDFEYFRNGEAGDTSDIVWTVSDPDCASVENGQLVISEKTGAFSVTAKVGDSEQTLNFEAFKEIKTAEDFAAIKDDLNGYYVLVNNIDFEGQWIAPIAPYAETGASSDNSYMPQENEFNGVFDGNGFAFRNFRPSAGNNTQNALFGAVGEEGVVKNISLLGVNGYLGGSSLVYWLEGRVENVYLEMQLVTTTSAITKNNPYAGIVTKLQINARVSNCIAVIECPVDKEFPAEKYGAIAGYVAPTSKIDNCFAYVNAQWSVASLPAGGQSVTNSSVFANAAEFTGADYTSFQNNPMWKVEAGKLPVLKNTVTESVLTVEGELSVKMGSETEITAETASGLYYVTLAEPVDGISIAGLKTLCVSDTVEKDVRFTLNVTLFADTSKTVSVEGVVSVPVEELTGAVYYDVSKDSLEVSLTEYEIPFGAEGVTVQDVPVQYSESEGVLTVSGVKDALGLAQNQNFGAKTMFISSGGTDYKLNIIVVSKIIMQSDLTDDPASLQAIFYAEDYKSAGENVTNWGGYYVLGEDITFSAEKQNVQPSAVTSTGHRFNGTFDGLGHTVSNFTTGMSGAMFTYLGVNAEVRNIRFVNAKTASNKSGGLISVISYKGAVVENIFAEVTIGAAGHSATEAGSNGMIVRSNGGTIRNCIAVVSDNCWTTDRHGYIASVTTGNIEHSYAIVTYTGTDTDGAAGIVTSSLNSTGDYSTCKVYGSTEEFFADTEIIGSLGSNGYNQYWEFDEQNKTISMKPSVE